MPDSKLDADRARHRPKWHDEYSVISYLMWIILAFFRLLSGDLSFSVLEGDSLLTYVGLIKFFGRPINMVNIEYTGYASPANVVCVPKFRLERWRAVCGQSQWWPDSHFSIMWKKYRQCRSSISWFFNDSRTQVIRKVYRMAHYYYQSFNVHIYMSHIHRVRKKRGQSFFCITLTKCRHIFVIFGTNHPENSFY